MRYCKSGYFGSDVVLQLFIVLLPLFSLLAAFASHAAAPQNPGLNLRFCYEDKPLEPYYRGHGDVIPKDYPGATIEHLYQLTAAIPGVTLQLERRPWKRCLAKLESGETDALVASYRPEREQIGNYPMLDGQPDPSRAFSEHHTCLVKQADSRWTWDGERVSGIDSLVVARPLGYAPLIVPGPQQVTMHYTLSGTMDLELLRAGRIHAVTTLCKIAGQPVISAAISDLGLQVLQPPLHSNTGYLMFSRQFYQKNPQIAQELWRQLQINKAIPIYHEYLKLHFLQPSAVNNTQ
jgi:polar amino acid transport system substrate-binding protein